MVNPKIKCRKTPLHLACRHGNYQAAQILLPWYNRINGGKNEPSKIARENGFEDLAEMVQLWFIDATPSESDMILEEF